jgi:hypothetical protein
VRAGGSSRPATQWPILSGALLVVSEPRLIVGKKDLGHKITSCAHSGFGEDVPQVPLHAGCCRLIDRGHPVRAAAVAGAACSPPQGDRSTSARDVTVTGRGASVAGHACHEHGEPAARSVPRMRAVREAISTATHRSTRPRPALCLRRYGAWRSIGRNKSHCSCARASSSGSSAGLHASQRVRPDPQLPAAAG